MVIDFNINVKNMRGIRFEELLEHCKFNFNVADIDRKELDIKKENLRESSFCAFRVWNKTQIGGRLYYYLKSGNIRLHLTFSQLLIDNPKGWRPVNKERVRGLYALITKIMQFLGTEIAFGGFDIFSHELDPTTYHIQLIFSKNDEKLAGLLKEHIKFWFNKEFSSEEVLDLINKCAEDVHAVNNYKCIFLIPWNTMETGIENTLHHYLKERYGLKLDKSKFSK